MPTETAFLEQHTYRGWYPPTHEKPFWIARCDHPSHGPIALNSGHHYTAEVKHHAEKLISEHDATEHPSVPDAIDADARLRDALAAEDRLNDPAMN